MYRGSDATRSEDARTAWLSIAQHDQRRSALKRLLSFIGLKLEHMLNQSRSVLFFLCSKVSAASWQRPAWIAARSSDPSSFIPLGCTGVSSGCICKPLLLCVAMLGAKIATGDLHARQDAFRMLDSTARQVLQRQCSQPRLELNSRGSPAKSNM